MAVISKTRRGKPLLIDGEFEYHLNSKNSAGTKIYWLCTKREICKARLVTNADIENSITILHSTAHSHLGDDSAAEVRSVTERIKSRAKAEPNSHPSHIIREELREVTDQEVILNVSETTSLVRMVNRIQNSARPNLPESVSSCLIAPPYNQTLSGDLFLRFDSGVHDPNRVLIFYSDVGLRSLCRSSQIFADGTFDTVPRIFFQLYTIHGEVFGYTFPFIYVLCLRKTRAVYENIINHLKEASTRLNITFSPETIMVDFEMAAIMAFKRMLPNSTVKGCLFHFNQSLWRRIQETGLSMRYRNTQNTDLQGLVVALMALPFIPEEDVAATFKDLTAFSPPELNDFIEFYGRTYIGLTRKGDNWTAITPKFEYSTWSCYNSTLSGHRRTNNVVEGWHSRFNGEIKSHHATIWKFLEFIRKDEADNKILIAQLFGGHRKIRHPIKQMYLINNSRILELVRSYDEFKRSGTVKIYLHSIGRLLKNNFTYAPQQNTTSLT